MSQVSRKQSELPSRERAAQLAEWARGYRILAINLESIPAPTRDVVEAETLAAAADAADTATILRAYAEGALVPTADSAPPSTRVAVAALALETIDAMIAEADTLDKAHLMLKLMRERFATGLDTIARQKEWIDDRRHSARGAPR